MAMDMNVALKITAGVTGQQAVDQLRTSMDRLQDASASVGRGFELAKTALGAFIGLQAVQGIATFAKATIDAADRLDEMSEQTGLAVDTLSELDYASKMSGKSLDDVQSALQRVSVKATDAATGNKTAALAFDALGIKVREADGSMRSSLAITEDIGQAFRGIQDQTLKAALAVEFFGKQGPTLVPLIEKLQDTRKEARDLGVVVGPEFAANAAQFNDNMDRLAFMSKAFAGSILNDVLPALSQMFREFNAGIKVFGSFGSALWNVGTTNPFRTPLEHAKNYSAEVSRLEANIKKLDAAGTPYDRMNANRLRAQLEDVRKLAQYFSIVSGYREAGAGRGDEINPPFVNPAPPDLPKNLLSQLTKSPDATKAANQQEQQRAQILQSLRDEVIRLTDGEDQLTLSRLQAAGATQREMDAATDLIQQRKAIADGAARNKQLQDDQQKAAQDLARQEDARNQVLQGLTDQVLTARLGEDELTIARLRSLGATDDQIAAARSLQSALASLSAQKKMEADAQSVFDSTRTPQENLDSDIARYQKLLDAGLISVDTYTRAVIKARDAFVDLGDKGKDVMADLKQAIDGWGKQAGDAFVKFAFDADASTKSVKDQFKDLVNSVLQDIARMLVYQNITKPLFGAISSMFPFANGGVMTPSGPLPLQAYSRGGIANSPQLALFGEGRMPEAYVPLPDGRSIPVTMQGGAGETNVVVNVNMETGQEQVQTQDREGAGALGKAIAAAVRTELINQRRPGGLLAA